MKYVYSFIGLLLFVLVLIVYFQNTIFICTTRILYEFVTSMVVFLFFVISISVLSGVFLTLGVIKFLEGNKELDDGFEL